MNAYREADRILTHADRMVETAELVAAKASAREWRRRAEQAEGDAVYLAGLLDAAIRACRVYRRTAQILKGVCWIAGGAMLIAASILMG